MEVPVVEALGCTHARSCPVTHGPCPGECVYADIMKSTNLGIAVFDLRVPAVLFLNDAARGYFVRHGIEPDFEYLRRTLFPPGVPLMALPTDYAGEPLRLDTRLIGFTTYRSGFFAWVFLRDITEKQRLVSIAEAVNTTNNIASVFSAVRHELGNPINSVKAALSVLRTNFDTFPREQVDEYLERIGNELGRVEGLLRSLRSFSMFEEPVAVPVDVGRFLEGFVQLARPDVERRGISLTLAAPPGTVALADPRALQQALLNLVANAADAADGLTGANITLAVRAADGLAHLTVADTGVGMSAEQLEDAFKPFHTSKAAGTGLGLVITRKLLLKMTGTIGIESKKGEGTTVHVTLPLAPEASA